MSETTNGQRDAERGEIMRSLLRLEAGQQRIEAKLDKHLDDDEELHRIQTAELATLKVAASRDRGVGGIVAMVLAVAAGLGWIPKNN